jgi:hypothetical protein
VTSRLGTVISKSFFYGVFNDNICRELGVKHDQLKLITPQFETPLPPLQVRHN